MKTIKAKLIHNSEESKKPFLELLHPHTNPDGSVISIIPSENVGIVRDNIYMDLPIMYHKLNHISMDIIKRNNFLCNLEINEIGEIRKIDDMVVIITN